MQTSRYSQDNGIKRTSSEVQCRKEKDSPWAAKQTKMHERFHRSPSNQLPALGSAALLKNIILQGRLYITSCDSQPIIHISTQTHFENSIEKQFITHF